MPASDLLKEKISHLPHRPGIYKFFDENGIIYVGKAVDIRQRVSSYFNKSTQHHKKTRHLIASIRNIEFTIVDTETDAFLLENNLIKQHWLKYNILLTHGITYAFIRILNERFPRVISTRNKINVRSAYFRPSASVTSMNVLFDLLPALQPMRTSTYDLSS